ncbi:MAG: IS66 family insertion sequence element accessory protein TnpB [Pontiella sp.]
MFRMNQNLKVVLATEPVDLRKSVNGLYVIARNELGEVPENGALFIFSNRTRTRIKVLCFDGTGCWVSVKRLEEGTFSWPKGMDQQKMSLKPEALALLFDGVDLRGARMRPRYQR